MAYDQKLADRIRERLVEFSAVEEKEMMGGLVFMLNDKMCIGIMKDELMCRVDPGAHDELIEKGGCRTMEFGKGSPRRMNGYILIDETGMKSQKDFNYWMALAIDFNKHAKSSKRK